METANRRCVLVFAGADPSGGAGIQADIQAIAALGTHPLSVITALTVQDNERVFAVNPVAPELVQQQAQALIARIPVDAVKIGIVGSRANAEAIAAIIRDLRQQQPALPVVLDPVLASGNGDALAVDNALQAIEPLLALATLVAPNLPEAAKLCGADEPAEMQAYQLLERGAQNVLIKGGHGSDESVVNRWFAKGAQRVWHWPRLAGTFHGSGCTLASAIAALLAQGQTMEQALDGGQEYCQQTLAASYPVAPGQRMPNRVFALNKEKP
jgi:hydroxymethylpyrimidine/phosphomethylpyrimidine kinase